MFREIAFENFHAPTIGDSDISCIGQTGEIFLHALRMVKSRPQTFWARVQEALEDAGQPTTQTHVATMLKLKQSSVSDWNKPNGYPTIANGIELAGKLKVCVEWLYTGLGPKRPPDTTTTRMLAAWTRLSAVNQGRLMGYAESLVHDQAGELGSGGRELQRGSG